MANLSQGQAEALLRQQFREMAKNVGIDDHAGKAFALRACGRDESGVGGMGGAGPADASVIARKLPKQTFWFGELIIPFGHSHAVDHIQQGGALFFAQDKPQALPDHRSDVLLGIFLVALENRRVRIFHHGDALETLGASFVGSAHAIEAWVGIAVVAGDDD